MRLVFDHGRGIICYEIDGEFWVYGLTGDPRVLPSEGMARSFAASAL